MPTTARKTLAVLLAILAVLAAALGLAARTADALVNTPEPLQRILGPLATNDELREILPQELGAQLTTQITNNIPVPIPGALNSVLEQAIATSSSALISDPGFAAAWETTIENTRSDYVGKLAAAKTDGATEATVELNLAPLLTSAYGTLRGSLDGSALGLLLPQNIKMPPVSVDTNWPDANTLSAPAANRWLGIAASWVWLLVGAGVLLVGALFTAPRGFRGKTWIALGAAALLLAATLIIFGTRLSGMPVQQSELTTLVIEQLVTGVRAELRSISNMLIIGGVVALLAGLGTWIWRKENPTETPAAHPAGNPRG